jgi:hypothetical protein
MVEARSEGTLRRSLQRARSGIDVSPHKEKSEARDCLSPDATSETVIFLVGVAERGTCVSYFLEKPPTDVTN